MRKITAVLMALVLALSLFACGKEPEQTDAPGSDIQQGTVILPKPQEDGVTDENENEQKGEYPSAEEPLPVKPDHTQKPQDNKNNNSNSNTQKPDDGNQPAEQPKPDNGNSAGGNTTVPSGEYRAVWISYLELGNMLTGKTASQFRSNIGAAYDNVKNLGCNTVIVHVRPFGDALYSSSYFPASYLITGTEGDALPFDPLTIMVEEAHSRGLTFEAWLNPYRVRARSGRALSSDNPAQKYINSGSDAVYQTANGGIFYNPGSREAIDLIVNGVREIVRNYDVDAIHFDDYFYATTDSSIDSGLYAASGSGLSLAAWRRQNVNTMVREVYAAVKTEKPSVRFGISPQGNTKANYDTLYADVATWLGNSGYVDYICPQIYYGFNNATCPYSTVLAEFNGMIKVSGIDLYVGLAAYKIGNEDTYAGANGKYEWQQNSDLLSRMVTKARDASHYKGFCLYSYNSVISPAAGVKAQVQAELAALSSIL